MSLQVKLLVLVGVAVIITAGMGVLIWQQQGLPDSPPLGQPGQQNGGNEDEILFTGEKVDDWVYEPGESGDGGPVSFPSPLSAAPEAAAPSGIGSGGTIGLAAGGAKDINNFRDNVENDYLPLATDLSYEGLFYDYFFDTGQTEPCDQLFCPSYSYATSRDPLSGEAQEYLAVGLNSGIQESDFARKKLNLVVVLDISGSMSSPFNRYYYDQFGNQRELDTAEESDKTKMQTAAESIVALLDHLNPEDRLGIVLFNSTAHLGKPISLVGNTDMQAIKDHILELGAGGGTQMSAGMDTATELFEEYREADQTEYENRIIFLTDAMPNIGETSEGGLLDITEQNAADRIFTTFIGIGVDFNTELVDGITKIQGANYYSVHSVEQFMDRMDEGFEYMVTPLVFDLNLQLEAEGYRIAKVYGSPEANEATGELMHVNTLFPSKREGGETRGGLVLLQLERTAENPEQAELNLAVSYEDRQGVPQNSEVSVSVPGQQPDFYGNSGIQKGIVLVRYVNLLKNWIHDTRREQEEPGPIQPLVTPEEGIVLPPPDPPLGQWERQSLPLQVSGHYRSLFQEFQAYMEAEKSVLQDETLQQELDILGKLSG